MNGCNSENNDDPDRPCQVNSCFNPSFTLQTIRYVKLEVILGGSYKRTLLIEAIIIYVCINFVVIWLKL